MKRYMLIVPIVALLAAGCAHTPPTIGPAITQQAVAAGAAFAIQQDANVLPYLQACQPIICSAAGSGGLNPADIVASLQSSSANEFKTPAGTLAINGALALYEAVYYSYGADVQASQVQPYLLAVCDGLKQATAQNAAVVPKASKVVVPKNWPHVR